MHSQWWLIDGFNMYISFYAWNLIQEIKFWSIRLICSTTIHFHGYPCWEFYWKMNFNLISHLTRISQWIADSLNNLLRWSIHFLSDFGPGSSRVVKFVFCVFWVGDDEEFHFEYSNWNAYEREKVNEIKTK